MTIKNHSILFRFNNTVPADGFLLNVDAAGRAIMKYQFGAWWLYGVSPAIASSGETPDDAQTAFRKRMERVLCSVVAGLETFEDMKDKIERFGAETSEPVDQMWKESLDTIRAGKGEIAKPFSEMNRARPEDNPVRFEVVKMYYPQPEVLPGNAHETSDCYFSAAA